MIEHKKGGKVTNGKESTTGDASIATADASLGSSFTDLSINIDKCGSDNDSKLFVLYDALSDICKNNVKYYECDETETGQRFLGAFRGVIDHIAVAKRRVAIIIQFAHEYDFDENTPANGYRSFVKAVQACINHSLKVSKYIAQNRSYLLFRKNMYMKYVNTQSTSVYSHIDFRSYLMIYPLAIYFAELQRNRSMLSLTGQSVHLFGAIDEHTSKQRLWISISLWRAQSRRPVQYLCSSQSILLLRSMSRFSCK